MSDGEKLMDLGDAREARRFQEALAELDAVAAAEGITPDSYLGRFHATMRLCFERLEALLRQDRVDRAGHRETALRTMEEAQKIAGIWQASAKDEVTKLDRAARKAEADLARLKLTLEDNATQLVGDLGEKLTGALREGNIVRARAYDRRARLRDRGLTLLIALGIFLGGMGLAHYVVDPPPATTDDGDR